MSYQRILRMMILSIATAAALAVPIVAQQPGGSAPRALTTADYARAEQFMTWNTAPLLFRHRFFRSTWPGRIIELAGGAALLIKLAEAIRDWEPEPTF